jgi:hypothetical protein
MSGDEPDRVSRQGGQKAVVRGARCDSPMWVTSHGDSHLAAHLAPGLDCVSVDPPYVARERLTWCSCFESGNVFAKAEKTVAEGLEICIRSSLLGDDFGQIAFLFRGESR